MHNTKTAVTLFALAAATGLWAVSSGDYKVEDREPVRHTLAGGNTLDVDLINGGVHVIGDDTPSTRIEGERLIRGVTQEDVDRAKKEVSLDMTDNSGVEKVYENGPYRNHEGQSGDRRYSVSYQLTIHVPRANKLSLHSVNGGLSAQDTTGAFDVKTVNGGINLTGVSGSGAATTVNGATVAIFRQAPKSDSTFTSVNGRIELSFPASLSGVFDLKTVHGEMFTDFESTMLASPVQVPPGDHGKFSYKSRGESHLQIGAGGPHFRLETVNGGIQVKKLK